jgi:drug/metabolite transporter (DMT)-like permease
MLYLLLNIVFGTAFTLCIKWVQNRNREDIITVGAINYIVALVCMLPEYLQSDFVGDTNAATLTGGVMGACYFIAYFFVIYAIKWIGAASTSVLSNLSILFPVGCGILIWNEAPSGLQIIGAALAVASLSLVGGKGGGQQLDQAQPPTRPWLKPTMLFSFFLLAGFARLAQEAFKHESVQAHRPLFLFDAFLVAAIPSVLLLLIRRRKISGLELLFGIGLGASNILQSHFTLKALDTLEGFVVFPVSSAGGLLLTTVVACTILDERLNQRTRWGIAIAITALFFLN